MELWRGESQPETIDSIHCHMNQETNSNKSRLGYCSHPKIDHDRRIRMQWMKSDPTALQIKDRMGKQMI